MYATEPLVDAPLKLNPWTFVSVISNPLFEGIVGFKPSKPPWNAIVNLLYDKAVALAFDDNVKPAVSSNENTELFPLYPLTNGNG